MDEEQFFKERADSNIFKQVIYKYLPFWPLFAKRKLLIMK